MTNGGIWKGLRKSELLEMLIAQTEENERLREELANARAEIERLKIKDSEYNYNLSRFTDTKLLEEYTPEPAQAVELLRNILGTAQGVLDKYLTEEHNADTIGENQAEAE